MLFHSGPLHPRPHTLCVVSLRPHLAHLRGALRHWHGPRLQQSCLGRVLAQPGAQQPHRQCSHLGLHRLLSRQHRGACSGRLALHSEPARSAGALGRRGRGLRLRSAHSSGLPGAGGQHAHPPGARGQDRLQSGDHAGRLQVCVPHQAAAWLHLAGSVCSVFGRSHGADAPSLPPTFCTPGRAPWACCAPCRPSAPWWSRWP